MATLACDPFRPRGQRQKYRSVQERKASKIAQQREKRQAARAAQRAQQFDQYYSIETPLYTDTSETPSISFPLGVPSIATELEQLLPPLSPALGPWELSTPDVLQGNEPTTEGVHDVVDEPGIMAPLENTENDANTVSQLPRMTESLVQATESLTEPDPGDSDILTANLASNSHDLARLLTDQLQHHHGCCHQCHTQQESEH
jgi:hypothetical protein